MEPALMTNRQVGTLSSEESELALGVGKPLIQKPVLEGSMLYETTDLEKDSLENLLSRKTELCVVTI